MKPWIFVVIVTVIIIGAFVFWQSTRGEQLPDDWMFIVDGVVIAESDILTQYNALTEEQKRFISINDVAQTLFERVLLLQEARAQNLALTQEEFDQGFASYLERNRITRDQLQFNLDSRGQDFATFEATLGQELLIQKLLDKDVPITLGIIDGDAVQQAYDESVYKVQGIPFEEVQELMIQQVQDDIREQEIRTYVAELRTRITILVRGIE